MNEKLKPCKCGAMPWVRKSKSYSYAELMRKENVKGHFMWWVDCLSCGRMLSNRYNSKAEAIEAWNRRVE